MVYLVTNNIDHSITSRLLYLEYGWFLNITEILIIIQNTEHLPSEMIALMKSYIKTFNRDGELEIVQV